MPLLALAQKAKNPHLPPLEVPAGLHADDEVYVVRLTGEVCPDYDSYLAKVKAYRAREWACAYSGRGPLTFEEAVQSEQRSVKAVPQVPEELHAQCFKVAHHSTLPFDDLISSLHEAVKPAAGQPAAAASDGKPAKPLAKAAFRRWLLESMEVRGRLWSARPQFVKQYGLVQQVSESVQQELEALAKNKGKSPAARSKAAAPPGKENKAVADAGPVGELKRKREAPKLLEEEEAALKPGTTKFAAFKVLQAYSRDDGLPVEEVLKLSIEQGIKTDWPAGGKRNLYHVLHTDPTFLRVSKHNYVLSALHPDREEWTDEMAKKDAEAAAGKRPRMEPGQTAACAGEGGDGSGQQQGVASVKDDAEVLARLERNATHTQSLLGTYKTKLEVAEALAEAAKRRLAEVEDKIKSPVRPSPSPGPRRGPADDDAGGEPSFELPPELREYKGSANDRKALMEFKRLQALEQKKLDRAREEWLVQQRSKKQQLRADASKYIEKEQKQLQATQLELEKAKKAYDAAVRAADEAVKALQRERQRQELRASRGAEREALERQRQAEREERERRRAEALEAKRYPIDDLELLAHLQEKAAAKGDPAPPDALFIVEPLEAAAGQRLADTLFLSDFLTQLGPAMGLQPLSYCQLDELIFGGGGTLAAAAAAEQRAGDGETGRGLSKRASGRRAAKGGSDGGGTADGAASAGGSSVTLPDLYQALLGQLLLDYQEAGDMSRLEQRWQDVLGPGTWAEVLRRYALARAASAADEGSEMVGAAAAAAVSRLASGDVEELSGADHMALLGLLTDDIMDMDRLRGLLAARGEAAADKAAEIKADMAEDRRKLRELLEAEKEARKKKREEQLLHVQAAADRAMREAGAPTGDGAAAAADGPAAKRPKLMAAGSGALEGAGASGAQEGLEDEEPCWDLPPELQEYTGDEGDRKALMAFRQKQQAERQRLDKARTKWQAEAHKWRRELEAKRRAQLEEERRAAKEKKDAEDAILARQEALERELEKHIVRRAPLGLDRHYRRYWWGLAGVRSALLVEADAGFGSIMDGCASWALISTPQQLEALVASLDSRGVREMELKRALQKVQPAIVAAMRKVEEASAPAMASLEQHEPATAAAAAAAAANGGTKRHSSRLDKATKEKEAPAPPPPAAPAPVAPSTPATSAMSATAASLYRQASLRTCLDKLLQLAAASCAAKVGAPAGGWKAWGSEVAQTVEGFLARHTGEAATPSDAAEEARHKLYGQVRECLLELQALLFGHSGQAACPSFAKSEEDDEEEGDEGEEDAMDVDEKDTADGEEDEAGEGEEDGGRSVRKSRKRLSHAAHHHHVLLDDDAPEELEEDEGGSGDAGSSRARVRVASGYMWRSRREQASWVDGVNKAHAAHRLAYCAAVLAGHAAALQLGEKGAKSKK